jgi:hypothetical protein
MQNVNVVSKPKLRVLSNGAFVFAVSLILCTGKWIGETIAQNCTCSQPGFSAYRTKLTGKPNATFERV